MNSERTQRKRRKRRNRSKSSSSKLLRRLEGADAGKHCNDDDDKGEVDDAPGVLQGATSLFSRGGPEVLQEMHLSLSSTRCVVKRGRRKRKRSKQQDDDASVVGEANAAQGNSDETQGSTALPLPLLRHPFEVDATDHCETPLEAYRNIISLLDQLAKSIGKTRASLSIYDPYYCDGGVKMKLKSLGYQKVRNDNQDFYKHVENESVPEFDVLVTNPPYSGVHVERLLAFAAKSRKPFLLLLPHYIYTKDYYQRALGAELKPFFLVPKTRYSYLPPSWVQNGSTAISKGKTTTAPFPSFWYCHTVGRISSEWMAQTFGKSGAYRHDAKIQYANCAAHIPRDMKGEFDATKKRPNPKARKRAAAKKRAAMASV